MDVLQVEGVAGVVFGHDEHGFGLRAGALHRVLGSVGGELDELGVEVVEAAGEEVHVDGGHFVAGVADVHRAVKRRGVVFPFAAEPSFDFGLLRQDGALEGLQVGEAVFGHDG